MLFNSYIFVFLFLPATLLTYYLSRRALGREASLIVLVVASIIYYAYWKVEYLAILIVSISINYSIGYGLIKYKTLGARKALVTTGIVLNLAGLGYYKYANFFIENVQTLTGLEFSNLHILLPLAISFFTFQQIAYLIDCYRNEAKEYSFSHYCLFITFFPQLIAGPIVHHKEMLPQFMDKMKAFFDYNMFWKGLLQFCIGLFKKVIIADTIALYATPIFFAADQGNSITMVEAWIAILAYSFQLYFDFSAYSDMAIGIGRMFGIDLPANFNSPYKARSIEEFWHRWHMTLSRFLRDYLYFTFGGNRKGPFRRYLNLILTMLLGGLWHGASWNFVAWGALHGIYLIINHCTAYVKNALNLNASNNRLLNILSVALTFLAVILAWVLFRAETFSGAFIIYAASINLDSLLNHGLSSAPLPIISEPLMAYAMIMICALITFMCPNTQEFIDGIQQRVETHRLKLSLTKLNLGLSAAVSGLLIFSLASMNKVSEFLYFQF
tara:strand:- start:40267 stop:41757 length:1491 start_codon:yes stop_codon:yes gene_type:complete